jgi:hypothetical protein
MTTPTGGAPMEKKSMNSPDETRTFEKGKLELTTFKNGNCYRQWERYREGNSGSVSKKGSKCSCLF